MEIICKIITCISQMIEIVVYKKESKGPFLSLRHSGHMVLAAILYRPVYTQCGMWYHANQLHFPGTFSLMPFFF